ncbi:MAG: hypothetical protein LBQ38_13050, partial [Spirochaetaceae bacterium]|nr:hypothetical protein [Spirochaetaceae bacterium]
MSVTNEKNNLPPGRGIGTTLWKKYFPAFAISLGVFLCCFILVIFNPDLLKRPVFQKKTDISSPSVVKYEKDGNLYIIDNGGFRLISMTTEGNINYALNINKMEEYTRFYDMAADEMGNLYVYAMEAENDAFLTKRDMIQKYDQKGKLIKNILTIQYEKDSDDRPHVYAQFGSMRCEKSILTFSRVQKEQVQLYVYDIYRDELTSKKFFSGVSDYSVGRLALKDFDNFVYTTRDGDIYEVKNGGTPLLRASFDFTEDAGGIIPWHPAYDSQGNIVFIDMISSVLYRLETSGAVTEPLPGDLFDELRSQGILVIFSDYGFWEGRYAGVFGEYAWYYDGSRFRTYENGITLALPERIAIIVVQFSFVLGILAFFAAMYLLFIRIL